MAVNGDQGNAGTVLRVIRWKCSMEQSIFQGCTKLSPTVLPSLIALVQTRIEGACKTKFTSIKDFSYPYRGMQRTLHVGHH